MTTIIFKDARNNMHWEGCEDGYLTDTNGAEIISVNGIDYDDIREEYDVIPQWAEIESDDDYISDEDRADWCSDPDIVCVNGRVYDTFWWAYDRKQDTYTLIVPDDLPCTREGV